jgi:hypothetical protein
MGMDLILGAIVLVAALRGWFRGFFSQAIRLGGLVGGVYLAGPLRDLARPIAAERLTSMAPDLLDRLLWWVAAVVAFVVLSGTATGLLNASRRRLARDRSASGIPAPSHRGDQSAGALFGAAKGAIAVAFLAGLLLRYAPEYAKAGGWVGEQVEASYALSLSERYQPAKRIWESDPVRSFVTHVRTMGLDAPEGAGDDAEEPGGIIPDPRRLFAADAEADADPGRSPSRRNPARRPAPLAVEPRSKETPADLQSALEEVRRDLERLDRLRDLVPR